MKYLATLFTLLTISNAHGQQNLLACTSGFCAGDEVYFMAPPQPGVIRYIDIDRNTVAVDVFDRNTGKNVLKATTVKDMNYNLRRRSGCTPAKTDSSFCVGERVGMSGSIQGVVVGVSPVFDSVVVRRDSDKLPENYWYGPTNNLIKLGDGCFQAQFKSPQVKGAEAKVIFDSLNVNALLNSAERSLIVYLKKAGPLQCAHSLNKETKEQHYYCDLK